MIIESLLLERQNIASLVGSTHADGPRNSLVPMFEERDEIIAKTHRIRIEHNCVELRTQPAQAFHEDEAADTEEIQLRLLVIHGALTDISEKVANGQVCVFGYDIVDRRIITGYFVLKDEDFSFHFSA